MQSTLNAQLSAPFVIEAARLFDGRQITGPRAVEIADGRIQAVHAAGDAPTRYPVLRLPVGALLAPGFIDVQVNGGGGALLNDDPSVAAIARIAEAHRRFGTTGLLPTLITDDRSQLSRLAACMDESLSVPGVLGFHLVGPFINPARKGIHPAQHIRRPSPEDMALLCSFGRAGRSLVTVAPEMLDAADIQRLVAAGLRIAIGHSDATAEVALSAMNAGATAVTHLFNAMSQMSPRAPGVVGASLANARTFAGIICDGLHVDPVNVSVALKSKGRDRLMLITDAMSLIGTDETEFHLQGRPIHLNGGRLTDASGTLAGAHLTMIDAVQNAIGMMGATMEDALIMASLTPARFLGLHDELGRIAPGFRADLVAIDEQFRVQRTWIGGV